MTRLYRPALLLAVIALCLGSLSLAAKPRARTQRVYTPQASSILFDHRTHKETPCATCHQGVAASTRSRDLHAPGMAVCATCHTALEAAPLGQCGHCHLGYPQTVATPVLRAAQWQAVRPAPMTLRRAQAKLHFSHQAHTARGLGCQTCHGAPGTSPTPTLPSMAQCVGCHEATPGRPAATCASCHTEPMGTLKSAPGQLTRPVVLAPKASKTSVAPYDHTADWIARHGVVAKASATACMSCHTEPSCAQCHDASAGNVLAAHPPNYIVSHRISAVGNSDTCTSCHVLQKDCLQCHAQSNLTPSLAPRKLDYHPPGWVDAKGAAGHGQAAKQNIQNCVSCHQERDCVSCHQGISPHPPTFATRCATLLAANPRPCATCHTDLSSLRARCL